MRAAIVLPWLGGAGPCLDCGCGHIGCAQTRERAARVCYWCGEALGYGQSVYLDVGGAAPGRSGHAACYDRDLQDEIDHA